MFFSELNYKNYLNQYMILPEKVDSLYEGKNNKNAFEEIKHRLIRPPTLHMPNCAGRFHLFSDMNKFTMGSALYQIQNGKPKLIAYVSKRLPEAARNYSIRELELCSLAISIARFSHLL